MFEEEDNDAPLSFFFTHGFSFGGGAGTIFGAGSAGLLAAVGERTVSSLLTPSSDVRECSLSLRETGAEIILKKKIIFF